jgi:hypothetical protein
VPKRRGTGPLAAGRDATLSECIRRNAVSSPNQTTCIDICRDQPDFFSSWFEFDNAATNLEQGAQPQADAPEGRRRSPPAALCSPANP